ncbi:helix-turn-helix domain-containing protein [Vallitalea guaymasensis]|uniref:Helix-turn-helix transcriptional regulator n=1 Tax=Vallitalea guaymasensis TaxID=1185412 RepID=A0A8J8M8H0_9FIRM|nr:helix-turn-helix transcriptional regulator [Vallitalea guaymasensis]QUH28296.1 helix-turn-helix transcriptional regulator [Vallitalea guaymasensis]
MFSNRLKALRIKNNMTQEELGKKVNLKKAAISKYENGKLQPNIDMIIKFAEIFGVSVDYISGRSDKLTPISNNKTNNEVDKKLDNFIEEIEKIDGLMFSGKPMDESTKDVLLKMLRTTKDMAKKMNENNK